MTPVHEELIYNLKRNIEVVINHLEIEKKENRELLQREQDLLKQLAEKNSEIENLEKKYQVLKMAKALEGSSGDTHDAKIKINRIVREIDRCIALLNR